MAELTPELAPQVIAACNENAEEAAGAVGRAFDGEYVLKAGEPAVWADAPAGAIKGPGLVMALKFGDEGMLVTLPAEGDLVPEWTKEPDATGESKLSTLGQELSMLLVPETLMADSFETAWVEDLTAAVERAQPADDAQAVPIEVARGETLGRLTLLWAVAEANAALKAPDPPAEEADAPADAPAPASAPAAEAAPAQSHVLRMAAPTPRDLRDLPPNVVSSLRVETPLTVSLAKKKLKLGDVVEIGPGSILTFDKPCDSPLEIAIGDRPIAAGEAVKVGERFGVRVLEMILPDEHFRPMLTTQRDRA